MTKIDTGHYVYKGYDIFYASHPKLAGKYEIYIGDLFIDRAFDLADARLTINRRIKK